VKTALQQQSISAIAMPPMWLRLLADSVKELRSQCDVFYLERKSRRSFMNVILKSAGAAALVSAAVLASMTPGEARNRWIGPAAAGFAAGAIVGSAATAYGSGYYGPGYTYGSAYDAYAYEPTYAVPAYDAYAYEPAPVYVAPRRYYRSGSRGCVNQGNYGQSVDESACNR
jgi:hypothetical protein